MRPCVALLLLILMAFAPAFARDYTPEDLENPNIADRRVYVADPGGLVSPDVKTRVNSMLYDLRGRTSAEVVVAVVPSIGDVPIEDFSERLFQRWGLGKSDKDNGVLILIAMSRKNVAHTDLITEVEGVLPDISARKIIERDIVPNMREGNLDMAVMASASDVAKVLTDPVAAEELKSARRDVREEPKPHIFRYDMVFRIMACRGARSFLDRPLLLRPIQFPGKGPLQEIHDMVCSSQGLLGACPVFAWNRTIAYLARRMDVQKDPQQADEVPGLRIKDEKSFPRMRTMSFLMTRRISRSV